MDQPTLIDYANLIITLFYLFVQTSPVVLRYQNLCTYKYREMIIFFMLMQFRRTYEFKTQNRWLNAHPEMMLLLNIETVPHRTTLSRQYKKLGEVVTEFAAFVGAHVAGLDEAFANTNLAEDKSLFKASGPVWHQSDRNEGRIPKKLRRLDTDATWSKSGYQGWVYGYGIHMTCTEDAFPKMVQVETASVADAGGPYEGFEGIPISLDAVGSSDPDENIVSYQWDLDDDGEHDDATGVNVEVAFGENGTYLVGLKVTDEFDETDTDTAEIIVHNLAPAVTADPAGQGVQYSDYIADVTITATDVAADAMNVTGTSWWVDGGVPGAGLPSDLSLTADGAIPPDFLGTKRSLLTHLPDIYHHEA